MSSDRPQLRSLLFVPGTRTEWLAKAAAAGADAAILDLEDAVPPAEKPAARARVADAVANASGDMAVLVRINPSTAGRPPRTCAPSRTPAWPGWSCPRSAGRRTCLWPIGS